MPLEKELKEFLSESFTRLTIIGIGNSMRADDGIGVKIVESLIERDIPGTQLINAGSVPEAFTDQVLDFKPSHVLLLDAANFRGRPGDVMLIPSQRIGGATFSTHNLPLTIFINYIEKYVGSKVILLGVQPKSIGYDDEMSPELMRSVNEIADLIERIIK